MGDVNFRRENVVAGTEEADNTLEAAVTSSIRWFEVINGAIIQELKRQSAEDMEHRPQCLMAAVAVVADVSLSHYRRMMRDAGVGDEEMIQVDTGTQKMVEGMRTRLRGSGVLH